MEEKIAGKEGEVEGEEEEDEGEKEKGRNTPKDYKEGKE